MHKPYVVCYYCSILIADNSWFHTYMHCSSNGSFQGVHGLSSWFLIVILYLLQIFTCSRDRLKLFTSSFDFLPCYVDLSFLHLATSLIGSGGRGILKKTVVMLYSVVYYNGSQRYGQFLQVGPCRLYRALTLLGLALYSKHLCVFGESINLTGVEDRCTKQLPVATSAASIKKLSEQQPYNVPMYNKEITITF